ncbi:MAG: flagellar assembly protein FliW [Verrucomicrobia bacterium]|nr:flagellar assembly protein FliW [Verrucomicrobiota bacterium]
MLTIEQTRVEEKIIPLFTETTIDLRLPCGLLGFEQIKNYKLHAFADIHPFLWLEAQDGNGLCFLVVPPPFVVESYLIELSDEDVGFLGLNEPDDAVVLNIATFHPDGSITVNLKGPIIYNRDSLVARQVVPKNASALSIKHPLGN